MIVLSQDSRAVIDICAGEIQQNVARNEQGEEFVAGFNIVLFGFNIAFPMATYNSLEEAETMFHDILRHWKDGDEWYDIRAREKAVFKR